MSHFLKAFTFVHAPGGRGGSAVRRSGRQPAGNHAGSAEGQATGNQVPSRPGSCPAGRPRRGRSLSLGAPQCSACKLFGDTCGRLRATVKASALLSWKCKLPLKEAARPNISVRRCGWVPGSAVRLCLLSQQRCSSLHCQGRSRLLRVIKRRVSRHAWPRSWLLSMHVSVQLMCEGVHGSALDTITELACWHDTGCMIVLERS